MKREEINLLCERFKTLLGVRFLENHWKQPFLPHGTAKEVFTKHKRDLQRLLQHVSEAFLRDEALLVSVTQLILESLSNVLAILLMDRVPNDTLVLNLFLGLILQGNNRIRTTLVLTDAALPITQARAEELFPDRGRPFYSRQLQFSAIVLQEEKEVKCLDNEQALCPLPYLDQKPIGEGAFGHVVAVKISSHHMRSPSGDRVNLDPVLLARKDFRLQRAFEKELEVLRNITRQPQRHNHLVPLLAILQHQTTYSLFFPLASCDLDTYLKRERHPPVPEALDEKKALFHRGVALVGALAFLHRGFSNMSCYHLDLKPSNILVYNVDTADEVWKITDFGLSRVRVKANSPTDGDSTMTIGVEGTYLAPECAVPGGKVSALSDVWSFGCIFSVVLTFMMEGRDGIKEFSRQRGVQSNGDYFYTNPTMPQVSPAVTTWFGYLKGLASREPCPQVMCKSLDFLLRKVLLPQRRQRLVASAIEADLTKIWTTYSHIEPPPTPVEPFAGGKSRWIERLVSANRSRPTPPPEFRSSARGSRFSPGGESLVSFTPNQNWILDLSDLSRKVVVQIPGSSNCLSVSDNYICNGLEGKCFKCCVYSTGEPFNTNNKPKSISLPALGSIKMAALSKDGALVAFIMTHKPGGTEMDCLKYLCATEDLIHTAADGGYPTPTSSRSNSAVSAPSVGSMTTKSVINDIGSAADVRFFGFAGDGQFLVMVAQEGTTSFRVKVWETQSDRLYQEMLILHRGFTTTTAAHFTACTIFVRDEIPHLFILSQKQYLINADLSKGTWKHRKLKEEMVHIHYSNDYETLIFLHSDRRHIFALPVSVVLVEDVSNPSPTKIGKTSSSMSKVQLSMTLRNKKLGRVEVVVATADGTSDAVDVTIPN